jgi:hypothetical protein
MTWIRAGIVYFAVVFAAGFVLGVFRVLVLLPRISEMTAVLLEIPVMLTIAWFVCRKVIARFAVAQILMDRLAMGLLALVLTLVAEAGISLFLAGRTASEHFDLYRLPHVQIGLAAQLVTALYPAFQSSRSSSRPGA